MLPDTPADTDACDEAFTSPVYSKVLSMSAFFAFSMVTFVAEVSGADASFLPHPPKLKISVNTIKSDINFFIVAPPYRPIVISYLYFSTARR